MPRIFFIDDRQRANSFRACPGCAQRAAYLPTGESSGRFLHRYPSHQHLNRQGVMGSRQAVRHWPLEPALVGSNPASPATSFQPHQILHWTPVCNIQYSISGTQLDRKLR